MLLFPSPDFVERSPFIGGSGRGGEEGHAREVLGEDASPAEVAKGLYDPLQTAAQVLGARVEVPTLVAVGGHAYKHLALLEVTHGVQHLTGLPARVLYVQVGDRYGRVV